MQPSNPGSAEKAAKTLVRFAGVTKSYDGRSRVVENLDLNVIKGEFLTLLGPSGSGKTTCLMMLAGFEAPNGGDIVLDGASITRLPPYKRNIGVVFQNYALFPHMSIADNVAFPLRQRGIDRDTIARKVSRALDMVRLPDVGSRPPSQLSGGQQQRIALARALVFEPQLVLMDEPLGALDRRLREAMQLEIKRIHDQIGMTTVYVTHDQSEALTMSDRIAVFSRGRIEQIGAPEDIYERPTTPFVANFIGENNSLYGRVEVVVGRVCSVRIEGGETVRADAIDDLVAGDSAIVMVRPESIVIDPGEGMDSRIGVVVEDVVYNGDHLLVACRSGDRPLLLKLPASERGRSSIEKGRKIGIGWRLNSSRAFRTVDANRRDQ